MVGSDTEKKTIFPGSRSRGPTPSVVPLRAVHFSFPDDSVIIPAHSSNLDLPPPIVGASVKLRRPLGHQFYSGTHYLNPRQRHPLFVFGSGDQRSTLDPQLLRWAGRT